MHRRHYAAQWTVKQQTPSLLKFKRLMRRLGETERGLVGLLEFLWLETGKNCPRGDVGVFSNDEIATFCRWEGDADELVNALVADRWLDACLVHRLVVHDWPDHAPRWVHKVVKDKWGLDFKGNKQFAVATVVPTTVATTVGTPSQVKSNQVKPKTPSESCDEPASLGSSPQTIGVAAAATECQPDLPGVVMQFPVVGKGPTEWSLAEAKLNEYQQSFPDLDVLAQLRAARQWCIDNRPKRKTADGMLRFCTNWLKRAQNSGHGRRDGPHDKRTSGSERLPAIDRAFEKARQQREEFVKRRQQQ